MNTITFVWTCFMYLLKAISKQILYKSYTIETILQLIYYQGDQASHPPIY